MTAYTNYQLPASHFNGNHNSHSQHQTTQDPFASQDFFATTPARSSSSAPARSASAPASNMADIIASQERAMAQSKRGNSSSRALVTTTNTHGSYPTTSTSMVVSPTSRNRPAGTSDAIHPMKKEMKQRRHVKMAAGGVGGALMGTLVLGPVGTVLGIPIGVYTTNKLAKQGERRAQRKFEQHSVQEQAMNSKAMQSAAFC
jgi:hypothetical protein